MMAVMERCSSDKKESREDADEGDGVMDEGDKSSTTRVKDGPYGQRCSLGRSL